MNGCVCVYVFAVSNFWISLLSVWRSLTVGLAYVYRLLFAFCAKNVGRQIDKWFLTSFVAATCALIESCFSSIPLFLFSFFLVKCRYSLEVVETKLLVENRYRINWIHNIVVMTVINAANDQWRSPQTKCLRKTEERSLKWKKRNVWARSEAATFTF